MMSRPPTEGYPYPYPQWYQQTADQSHIGMPMEMAYARPEAMAQQWIPVPTAAMGSMVHPQNAVMQQPWPFMSSGLGSGAPFSQVPMMKVMPQMRSMRQTSILNVIPGELQPSSAPKRSSSKPRKRSSKATTKVDNPDGNTKLTTFFEEADSTKGDSTPQGGGNTGKKVPPEHSQSTSSGGEQTTSRRRSSGLRRSRQNNKKPLTSLEDIVQFSKYAAPAMSSYGFLNDIDALQMPIMNTAYARLPMPQPWGPPVIPTPMGSIMTPSPMIPMHGPVASPFTTMNAMQPPMSIKQMAPTSGNISMEMMMEPTMAPPSQEARMMPLMTPQQVQKIPVPVLPAQTTSPSILMESIIPKSKRMSRRSGKSSSDGAVKDTAPSSGSSKKVKFQGDDNKVPTNQQAQFPPNNDGAVSMSIGVNPIMESAQSVPNNTAMPFPMVQMVGNNAPYPALDNGVFGAPPAMPLTMPLVAPVAPPLNPPMGMPVTPVSMCMPESPTGVPDVSDIPIQPPTPMQPVRELPTVNPPNTEQHSVVDEIKQDKEAVTDVQKDKLSAPAILIESFQQVLENKRRRMRNCLTEDCKNLLGEYTKIETPFPIKWINGSKYFYVKDIVTSLLPYHMFYYEQLRPTNHKIPEKDYSHAEREIEELKMKIIDMKVKAPLSQQSYECTKSCLEALSKLSLRKENRSKSAPRR